MIQSIISAHSQLFKNLDILSGVAPLLIRLIVAPVMIIAGYNKLNLSDPDATFPSTLFANPDVVGWFGNSEWGLGLPFPDLLAFLAGWTEFLGGWFILIGLFTRLISIPLMITMVVAATTVHLEHGWFAVTPTNPDTSAAKVFEWLGSENAKESLENSLEASERLSRIKQIIDTHGYPEYLYERGNVVILNNGIEFASIYFVMFLCLFFYGGGRLFSVDYWLSLYFKEEDRHFS